MAYRFREEWVEEFAATLLDHFDTAWTVVGRDAAGVSLAQVRLELSCFCSFQDLGCLSGEAVAHIRLARGPAGNRQRSLAVEEALGVAQLAEVAEEGVVVVEEVALVAVPVLDHPDLDLP